MEHPNARTPETYNKRRAIYSYLAVIQYIQYINNFRDLHPDASPFTMVLTRYCDQYMNKRQIGSCNERTAEEYLTALGMETAARNFRTRTGEIDLIMTDKSALVFVEVKFRAGESAGSALEAIDIGKRRQIVRVSQQYLALHREYADRPVRYDCIGINGEDISYIRNAFDIKGNVL